MLINIYVLVEQLEVHQSSKLTVAGSSPVQDVKLLYYLIKLK